jgi:multiple sugar transport system permease protein
LIGNRGRRSAAAYVLILPWLLGFAAFTIYPLAFSLYSSLCRWTFEGQEWVGLLNYIRIFRDRGFWQSILNTVLFEAVSAPVTLSIALLLAILINQKLRGVNFFRALFFLPVVAASDVISTLAGTILFTRVMQVNIDLSPLGINLPPQVLSYLTIATMLLTVLIWRTGIQMLIFLMGLKSVPTEFRESAEIDGASRWQIFWWVTIPALLPYIVLNLLLTVVESFTSLATTIQIIGGGYIQLFIWDYVQRLSTGNGEYGAALAVVWVFIIGTLAVIGLVYRLAIRRSGAGAGTG